MVDVEGMFLKTESKVSSSSTIHTCWYNIDRLKNIYTVSEWKKIRLSARVKTVSKEIRVFPVIGLMSFCSLCQKKLWPLFSSMNTPFKKSTIVEALRKREFLMTFDRLQPFLGPLPTVSYKIPLNSWKYSNHYWFEWDRKASTLTTILPMWFGEPLKISGLPVNFWNSRIAMIRRSLMAKLLRGGDNQVSWSTMSPFSET